MKATLLYDEDCGFCRWSVDKILAWDRRGAVCALAIQSPEGRALLDGRVPDDRMLESWHLDDGKGALYSAGDVAAPLAGLLPFGAPVALVARAMPGVTRRAYGLVARNRERIGRRLGADACSVNPLDRQREEET